MLKLFLLLTPVVLAASKSEDQIRISPEESKATQEDFNFWARELQSSTICNRKTLAVVYGTGDGNYCAGDEISIVSHKCKGGKKFSGWTLVSGNPAISNVFSSKSTLIMPDSDAAVEATCAKPLKCKKMNLSVDDGTGGGKYCPGDEVSIKSKRCKGRTRFSGWESIKGNPILSDTLAPSTTLIMPDINARVKSVCKKSDCTEYTLVVDDGSGDGKYCAGDEVSIKSKKCTGKRVFSYWESVKGDPDLRNTITSSTILVMPDRNAKVKSVCERSECTERTLVIINGSGNGEKDGEYCLGSNVSLVEDCPSGSTFVEWTVVSGGAVIEEKDKSSTVLIMPDQNSRVEATCTTTPVTPPSSQPVRTPPSSQPLRTRRPTRNPGATRRPVRPNNGGARISDFPSVVPSENPSLTR